MPHSLLPATPRGLALALATLALVGAAFAGPAIQRAEATAPDPDATVISLTCELADDLIGCQLISAREFDRDEGVRFVVSVGGETQTVSATREVDRDGGVRFVVSVGGETQDGSETGPPSGAGSACGEDDGVCYAFSFTAFGAGDDVQVSEVEAISEDDAAPAQQAVKRPRTPAPNQPPSSRRKTGPKPRRSWRTASRSSTAPRATASSRSLRTASRYRSRGRTLTATEATSRRRTRSRRSGTSTSSPARSTRAKRTSTRPPMAHPWSC